jgi:hypothetical protein
MSNANLITQDDLSQWLDFKQRADIERTLQERGIRYIIGKGGKICTTLDAINEVLKKPTGNFDEIEFADGPEARH